MTIEEVSTSALKEVHKASDRKLVKLRQAYYDYLNRKAKYIAHQLSKSKPVTKLILDYIKELYQSAKSEGVWKSEHFESAYHNPISSEVEFLVARVLYYYSESTHLGWKILLRKQSGKTAPDIRIELGSRTLAIIEIKAKAGWIQS